MPRFRQEIIDVIKNELVQAPDDVLGMSKYERAVDAAIRFYSEANPLEKIMDQTGDGGTFEWAVPDDWLETWSHIVQVEYPAGEAGEKAIQDLVEMKDYQVVRTATGTFKWRLLTIVPDTGKTVRFTYTTRHVLTDDSSTLPHDSAEDGVLYAGAYVACMMAAAYYTRMIPANLVEDTTDHSQKAQLYLNQAGEYKAISGLADIIDMGGAEARPATFFRELDVSPQWGRLGGGGHLTHRKL